MISGGWGLCRILCRDSKCMVFSLRTMLPLRLEKTWTRVFESDGGVGSGTRGEGVFGKGILCDQRSIVKVGESALRKELLSFILST